MRSLRALFGFVLIFFAAGAFAQAPKGAVDPATGLFFSPNPDDTSGPPIRFFADLSADEESAVTESLGKGHVDFTLDRVTLRLNWKLTYNGLTSPALGAHIHGPQTPGGEASIMYDLAPNGMKSPVEGSVVLNDSDVLYLTQDRLYVNLSTAKYKAGELRGSIRKARPAAKTP